MTGENLIERDADRVGAWIERHMPHHHAQSQTPATQPVNLAASPAPAATTEETTMSVLTEFEDGWNTAKAELSKFEQKLPGALQKAKAFEASPFAQIAEKAAGSVLPPEAVAIAVSAADKVIDDLIGLYGDGTTTAAAGTTADTTPPADTTQSVTVPQQVTPDAPQQ